MDSVYSFCQLCISHNGNVKIKGKTHLLPPPECTHSFHAHNLGITIDTSHFPKQVPLANASMKPLQGPLLIHWNQNKYLKELLQMLRLPRFSTPKNFFFSLHFSMYSTQIKFLLLLLFFKTDQQPCPNPIRNLQVLPPASGMWPSSRVSHS